jgi:SAM-dependent methyltransferase
MWRSIVTEIKKTNFKWLDSVYGQSCLATEKPIVDKALRQITGPRVLQIGQIFNDQALRALDFPQLILVNDSEAEISSTKTSDGIVADAAFLPFDAGTISSVMLPHVLERHELPHQVLREAHRVLMPEGHLILTGFSPGSLLGLQRYITPYAAYGGTYYGVKRVKDWMQLLGFEVIGSAMYQYAPLVKGQRLRSALNFINSVGHRWLPMSGGGYMISAKKRELGMRLVGKLEFASNGRKRQKLATASSRQHNFTGLED